MTETTDSPRLPDSAGPAFPLHFLASGRLVSMRVGGREVLREAADRSGFFVAWFDGTRMREIPLPHVTVIDGAGIRVVADTVFPRLAFSVSVADESLAVVLKRVEGMPAQRDVSVGFRAGLSTRCTVTVLGANIIAKPGDTEVQVFWTGLNGGARGADYGGFILRPEVRT
ncbi:MAG: hypothetical protein WCQ44_01220 [Opitutaceae bacterium]|jgi:hypothetical protein